MERHDKKVFLDLNHTFGINAHFKNSLSIIEEDQAIKLIYTSGKTIVKCTLKTMKMQFIRLTENIQSIECLSISPNRTHIAICEKLKNENFLLLNLYGLRAKDSEIKHFKLPQTQKQSTFKAIAFAPSQTKYACCLTGQPDYQLIFLDVSRSRGLAVSNFSVQNAQTLAICPSQSHLISCAGKNLFKLFKVQDYTFKTVEQVKKLPKTRNFTSHSWFDKTKILIGTDRGELFMVGSVGNNFQVKRHFANVFGIQNHDLRVQSALIQKQGLNRIQQKNIRNELSVSSICVFSKGFILGSNQGNFSLWVKQDESEQNFQDEYTGDLTKKWKVPNSRKSQVNSIAICPNEEIIAVTFQNNTIAYTSLQKLKEDLSNADNSIQHDYFTYLYDGFHNQGVSYLDVCMHRPLIATLSKQENTVRIWNYKNPRCQLIKKFDNKIDGIQEISTQLLLCLALHPLGYYIAIGCCDKLRMYHILHKQLRNYRQIVLKGVCQLKFSNGGHMLAAAYPRQKYNIHQINVYNAYTLEEIGRLSDHSNIITDLCWKPNDKSLISVGIDGTVSQWKQVQNRAEGKEWSCNKWSQNNSRYTSVIFEKAVKSILVAGNEGAKSVIREIRTQKDQPQKLNTLGFKVTKLKWLTSQWNIPAILAGTQEGHLKVFNSTFDNIVEQSLNIHLRQINKIEVSPCGRYVFTIGEDGNIFIYQVSLTNRQGYMNKRLHENVNQYQLNPMVKVLDDQLADIVLVQRNDINEKIRYIKMLEKNMEEMKRKLIIQDQDDKRKHDSSLNQISNQKQKQIDELNSKLEDLKNTKKDLEITTQASFLQLQNKNAKMLEDIEALYQKKLALQNKKYFQLEVDYDQLLKKNVQDVKATKQKNHELMSMLKQEFVDTFKKAQRIHESKQKEVIDLEKQFSEKVNQVEEQHEDQLKHLGKKLSYLQEQKTQKTAQYKTSISSLQRQIKLLDEQIIRGMSDNQKISQVIKDLRKQLNEIKDNIQYKKNQLTEKQENLKLREEKISEYQGRIGDLQKKKQVLSYRTWQMRQQIQPKEDEIDFLKEQLFGLEKQFETLLNEQKTLKQTHLKIKKQKQRLQKLQSQQKMLTKDKEIKLKRIYTDINAIIENKNIEKKSYENQMANLFQRYSIYMTDSLRLNQSSKGLDEMVRHMEHLDRQIKEVNTRVDKKIIQREEQIQRLTQENFQLISKVSTFRSERKKLQDELLGLEKIADSIKRQTKQIRLSALSATIDPPMSIYKKPSQKTLTSSIKQQMVRSSSQPLKKGKLVKGLNYDNDNLSIFARAKVKQLENRLQQTRNQFIQKEMLLKILKSKVFEHMQEQNCSDGQLEKCVTQNQL